MNSDFDSAKIYKKIGNIHHFFIIFTTIFINNSSFFHIFAIEKILFYKEN